MTHEDTYNYAEEHEIYWGAYIKLKESGGKYSLKLYFNIGQCIEKGNYEQIKEKIQKYRVETIKSTDKRITVKPYDNISKKDLPKRFDELFSLLKKLQKLYLPTK